jgi:biopolymer transport protein ExbB
MRISAVSKLRSMIVSFLLAVFVFGFISSLSLVTPSAVHAQEEDKPKEDAEQPVSKVAQIGFIEKIMHFFFSVGPYYGLLFILISVGMVALFIIELIDLRLGEAVPPAFVEEFTEMVNKRQFKQAYDLCRNESSFIARVMSAGMARLQYGVEDAREAMLATADVIKSSKESWIAYFGMMGTVGPLLGLVGTVWSMMASFYVLGKSKTPDASQLASELSHGLAVTLAGIFLALPAIFAYTFFKNRLISITLNTINLADDLLTQLYHNSKKPAAAAPSTAVAERAGKG